MAGRDLEQVLRETLAARAEDVQPDPRTWRRVRTRIRRGRRLRLALAGIGAATALALAGLAVPALLSGPEVDFTPFDPPEGPAPPAEAQAPGQFTGGACWAPEAVAGVASLQGSLWALCVDGSTSQLTTGPDSPSAAEDTAVAFQPDGGAIVFERRSDGAPPLLQHLDLATGEAVTLGGGQLPALNADGMLAWVMDEPGRQPLILVGEPFSEPIEEISVADESYEEFTVHTLAWTPEGDLLFTAGYEGSVLWGVELSQGSREPSRRGAPPPTTFAALAPPAASAWAAPGQTAAVSTCCVTVEGDTPDQATLGILSYRFEAGLMTDAFQELTRLDGLPDPGFDPRGAGPVGPAITVSSAAGLDVSEAGNAWRWERADHEAWVVSDGDRVWFVRADGSFELLASDFGHLWVNPGADPDAAAEGADDVVHSAPQDGLPEAVATTRLRIHQAARAREWGALESLMASDFTVSFGTAPGSRAAVEYLQELEARGNEEDPLGGLVRVLDMPYGVLPAESAGTHYFWPRPAAREPDQWDEEDLAVLRELGTEEDIKAWREFGGYTGWRLVISEDGTWTAFVAGD